MATKFNVGLDVGSTTVKACVVDAPSGAIVWQDYQRHETKQPEKCLEFLQRMGTIWPMAGVMVSQLGLLWIKFEPNHVAA